MLITELKPKEEIEALLHGPCFILNCHGCREIGFPVQEAEALEEQLAAVSAVTGILTTDYLCNPAYLKPRLAARETELAEAETVLVFSCGVGVQTVAEALKDRRVCAGCDTLRLPGFQGVTPPEVDCGRCGQCYLNLTGGICPVTSCSKSLLNGQCGGAKNGKCEVDPEMDCGWERIYRRLAQLGRTELLRSPAQFRDYTAAEQAAAEERNAAK